MGVFFGRILALWLKNCQSQTNPILTFGFLGVGLKGSF
jgi:hypothetical protein